MEQFKGCRLSTLSLVMGIRKVGMKNFLKYFAENTSGVTTPIVALGVTSLIGILGVTLEAGYWYKSKTDLQITADMAAYAGAVELENSTNDAAITAAKLDALENGYDSTIGSITVSAPALTGAYVTEESVEVRITQKGTQFFSALFGNDRISYNVRAVASLVKMHEACVLALNTSAPSSINITGSVSANLPNCSLASNSNSSTAITLAGSAYVIAKCLTTVGGISGLEGHATLECGAGKTGTKAYNDPYADVVVPSITDYPLCKTPVKTGKWDYALDAGRYCNNMTIKGTYSLDVGNYLFDAIDVKFIGNVATLIGSEVTIFLMNGATLSGLNGGASIIIEAPTSGIYAGLAIFSDPATQPSGTTVKLNGGSATSIEGIIYFPGQHVEFGGNTDLASACSMLIADTVDMKGNADFEITNCESVFGLVAPKLSTVFVVE